MKKVIVIAAIVFAASVSQAYSISWGARNMYIPVASDVTKSQSGIIPTSGSKFGGADLPALTVSLFWVGSEGDVKLGDYQTTGAGVIAAINFGDTSGDVYKAMVKDHGTTWKPEYHFTATYSTADGIYTYDGTAVAGKEIGNLATANIAATGDFKTAGSWTYTANAVPEPTSGLLLLLGVAGLALKRKRA